MGKQAVERVQWANLLVFKGGKRGGGDERLDFTMGITLSIAAYSAIKGHD